MIWRLLHLIQRLHRGFTNHVVQQRFRAEIERVSQQGLGCDITGDHDIDAVFPLPCGFAACWDCGLTYQESE